MARPTSALAALGSVAVLAALLVPTSGAAAGDSCTAWGTLPARVTLGPHGATIRTTLHGTAGCSDASLDYGATALLAGPGRNDDVPLRWARFGDAEQATYYPTLNRPGTYRVVDGDVQVYDAQSIRIPSGWRDTRTVVKYRGRFTSVAVGRSGASATLQAYGHTGWAGQADVRVALQRRTARGSWRTIATGRSSGSGRLHLAARVNSSAAYRLVSATTADVWGAARPLRPAGV